MTINKNIQSLRAAESKINLRSGKILEMEKSGKILSSSDVISVIHWYIWICIVVRLEQRETNSQQSQSAESIASSVLEESSQNSSSTHMKNSATVSGISVESDDSCSITSELNRLNDDFLSEIADISQDLSEIYFPNQSEHMPDPRYYFWSNNCPPNQHTSPIYPNPRQYTDMGPEYARYFYRPEIPRER